MTNTGLIHTLNFFIIMVLIAGVTSIEYILNHAPLNESWWCWFINNMVQFAQWQLSLEATETPPGSRLSDQLRDPPDRTSVLLYMLANLRIQFCKIRPTRHPPMHTYVIKTYCSKTTTMIQCRTDLSDDGRMPQ